MTNNRGASYEGARPPGEGQPPPADERRVALVIGNARYDHGKALANPHNDAAAIAAMLARLGFQLHAGAHGWHADLGLIEMRRVLADFGIKAEGADMAVVYFAGHGMEVDGENYLLPRDCALDHVRRVRAETVSLKEVLDDAGRAWRLPLVILDACRVNEFAQRMRGLHTTRSFRGGLADIDPPGDVLVAYAARHGLPALDGGDGPNSPYAKALLEHLETPDVDVRFLFGRVRDSVRAATNGAQMPHLYASLGGEPIYLKRAGLAAPTCDATPGDADDRLWARIEGSERIADFEFYLEQFPTGRHAALARFEARRLKETAEAARRRAETEARAKTEEEARQREASNWAWAEQEKTIEAYERFLATWPQGRFSDEARKRIATLKASPPAPRPAVSATGNVFTNPTATVNQAPLRERSFEVRVGDGKSDKTVRVVSGETIPKDAPFAPEMVLVPPGKYLQGDETGPVDGVRRREVTIGYPLLVGKYPVTFEEWDAYVAKASSRGFLGIGSSKPHKPSDRGWGRGRRPVIDVSWHDAKAYAVWLSETTGKTYRLLSESEWEYACRAGTQTAFSFGDTITRSQAQFSDGSAGKTVEVGSFTANEFGLFDMHGNVWEWCEDAWHDGYQRAPADGSARSIADTSVSRVLRGGSWDNIPQDLRSANRVRILPDNRGDGNGFRLARTLNPSP